jgi:hypothetical protein
MPQLRKRCLALHAIASNGSGIDHAKARRAHSIWKTAVRATDTFSTHAADLVVRLLARGM